MNQITIILAFLMILLTQTAALGEGQTKNTVTDDGFQFTDRSLKEFNTAYSFLLGQKYSVDRFYKVSPERTEKIMEPFKKAFPDLLEIMTSILVSRYSAEEITNYHDELYELMKKNPAANFVIQEENFVSLEKAIKKQVSGELPDGHLRTFLSVIYRTNSADELQSGFKETYNFKDHEKALGLNIKIIIPKSWKGFEAKGAHMIQKWQKMNGGSQELYMLGVDDLQNEFKDNPRKVFAIGDLEQVFLDGGELYSRYINNDFENTVLSYQGRLNGSRIANQPEINSQLMHMNAMVIGNRIIYIQCKKTFVELTEETIDPDMDYLKQECDLLTKNLDVQE
tara:strand:+ start:215 stop:1228 length:1014 start_codon:yes stop_codon:yes gene_type:complete